MFLKKKTMTSTENCWDECRKMAADARLHGGNAALAGSLKRLTEQADAVVIGAGAGLSTSAGFTYSGERFRRYFSDFSAKYGFEDMYYGGFYPYRTLEEYWAYWSRYIWINRYMSAPKPVYDDLLELVGDKEYFVLTTNVDHCFQKAGFDKQRLFYTQGDYGLWQCSKPCHKETYDNRDIVMQMLQSQGFSIDENGELCSDGGVSMSISPELVPVCPKCGRPMTMNLRADGTFVEDSGWHEAAARYSDFLKKHRKGRVVYLELGVGSNTPVIIKYPFWKMTAANREAVYACINYGEAGALADIAKRSICIDADIGEVLSHMTGRRGDGDNDGVER